MHESSDSVDRFAAEAALFEDWARHSPLQGAAAAREALIRITTLYLAALQLPPEWDDVLTDQLNARTAEEQCQQVTIRCAQLPLDFYGEVFDPLLVPPEDPVVGSLVDDIVDIYRDVSTGLKAYQAGARAEAIWEWGFGLRHHWGEHATNAMRALHCWLATHAADHFSPPAK